MVLFKIQFEEAIIMQKLTYNEKEERAKDADVFIIANNPLSADIINSAENLKMISVGFTGADHVDIAAFAAKNVLVCNVQGYATGSQFRLFRRPHTAFP